MRILLLLLMATEWAVLSGQTHPYSNAWSYYTTAVTHNSQFTATTVAGTGGTATHTMSAVAVYVQSPSGRSASAYHYPMGTSGQATTYLSLCGNGVCKDGQFFVSTSGTTEHCGQTGQTLILPVQSGNNAVSPWLRWDSAQISATTIPKQNGSAVFTGTPVRSTSCTAVSDISCGIAAIPSNMLLTYEPNSSQAASFTGIAGTVSWNIRSAGHNPVGGTARVVAGINVSSCQVNGSPTIGTTLAVNP